MLTRSTCVREGCRCRALEVKCNVSHLCTPTEGTKTFRFTFIPYTEDNNSGYFLKVVLNVNTCLCILFTCRLQYPGINNTFTINNNLGSMSTQDK